MLYGGVIEFVDRQLDALKAGSVSFGDGDEPDGQNENPLPDS
jgi:hypothetical protein